jgi:lysophospholipase L1-like esterase
VVARLLRLSLAFLACSAIASPSAGASVLYVGDSLGVGTSPYLREQLGAVGLEVDAEIGRPSGVGVDVLGSLIGPEHDVVVFDLGTNDDPGAPAALAADLAQAREIAGDRCLVVATLNRPPLNGVPFDGLNRAVTSFAARDPSVSLVDWHAAAAADPGMLIDGVHADAAGYALRAGLFADAIASCTAFGGSAASSPTTPLEHETGDLPPAASAGRNTGRGAHAERPSRGEEGGARSLVLATEVARAVATGADFG